MSSFLSNLATNIAHIFLGEGDIEKDKCDGQFGKILGTAVSKKRRFVSLYF
jgi:hypothetical protein